MRTSLSQVLGLSDKRIKELNEIENHDIKGQKKDKNSIPSKYQYIYDSFQIDEKPNVKVFIKELLKMKSGKNLDSEKKKKNFIKIKLVYLF